MGRCPSLYEPGGRRCTSDECQPRSYFPTATTFASSLANPEEAVRTAALNEAHSGTLNRNWAGLSRQGAQLEAARVARGVMPHLWRRA